MVIKGLLVRGDIKWCVNGIVTFRIYSDWVLCAFCEGSSDLNISKLEEFVTSTDRVLYRVDNNFRR